MLNIPLFFENGGHAQPWCMYKYRVLFNLAFAHTLLTLYFTSLQYRFFGMVCSAVSFSLSDFFKFLVTNTSTTFPFCPLPWPATWPWLVNQLSLSATFHINLFPQQFLCYCDVQSLQPQSVQYKWEDRQYSKILKIGKEVKYVDRQDTKTVMTNRTVEIWRHAAE